ncbi:MAG: hypothetical protein MUC92_13200 [Fimbriimonadaceae bacterium]|nr:hypothetical protein [Fimbriimonadaceae bacterium]
MIATTLLALSMAKTTQSVDLAWKPTVGDIQTYNFTIDSKMDMGGSAMQMVTSFVTQNQITKVEGDLVTTRGTMRNGASRMIVNGQTMKGPGMPPGRPVDVVHTKRGILVSVSTPGGNSNLGLFQTLVRPEKLVAPGDKWQHTWEANKALNLNRVKIEWTYEGEYLHRGNLKTHKITFVMTELDKQDPVTGEGTFLLNPLTTMPHRLDGTIRNFRMDPRAPASTVSIRAEIRGKVPESESPEVPKLEPELR